MKGLKIILVLSLSFFFQQDVYSQDSTIFKQKDIYYVYEIGCDTARTQQDINVCFAKALNKLTDITNKKYNCIVSYLDSEINQYSKQIKDSSYARMLIRMKTSVIESQGIWGKLKDANELYYKGDRGTMTPLLEATSIIEDLKNRLRKLDYIIEDLEQGGFRVCEDIK
jgi:uncharacterized protein YecT (DUF1311 family)